MVVHEEKSLHERNMKVFIINPKLIHKFRDAYANLDKTDRIDAWIIANRLRFGRLTTTVLMQKQSFAFSATQPYVFPSCIHNLTREKQYFLQNLFYKCHAFRTKVDSINE